MLQRSLWFSIFWQASAAFLSGEIVVDQNDGSKIQCKLVVPQKNAAIGFDPFLIAPGKEANMFFKK